jgi:CBS domain-containing protein
MKVEEWMSREVFTCRPDSSMNEAAYLLWQNDCGVLPVVDAQDKVVGIITDRDMCMSACLRGAPLSALRVQDAMSRAPITCSRSDTIEHAIRLMSDHQVRRIPVVDAQQRVEGILSMNDLARNLVSLDSRQRAILEPRFVEALSSISETREAGLPEPAPSRTGARRQPLSIG